MSWSRSYQGTPAECIGKALAEQETVEAPLPEFEKPQVAHVIRAATDLLSGVPTDAQISLSISGHGWRVATSIPGESPGAGSMAASVSYTLPRA